MAKTRIVIALDENHETYVENGRVARKYNSDAVVQTVKTRLLLIRQEWFLNLDAGLPWFAVMLGKRANLPVIKSYVVKQILSTDGVVEILRVDIVADRATRKFELSFEYIDEYGQTISGEL